MRPVDAFVVRAARLAGVAAGLAGSVARQTEEANLARATRLAVADAVVLITAREPGTAPVTRTGGRIDGRVDARAIGPRIALPRCRRCLRPRPPHRRSWIHLPKCSPRSRRSTQPPCRRRRPSCWNQPFRCSCSSLRFRRFPKKSSRPTNRNRRRARKKARWK